LRNHALTAKEFRHGILFAAMLYLLYKFIALVTGLVLIFSVSTIATLVMEPMVSWLERHKIKRHWSASILAIVVICLVGVGIALVIVPASRQIKDLWPTIPQKAEGAQNWVIAFLNRYPEIKNAIPAKMPDINPSSLSGPLIGGASKATAGIAAGIAGLFLSFVCMIYMLANPKPLVDGLLRPLSPLFRMRSQSAGTRIATSVRAWAVGVLIGMVFIFALSWIALLIIGIKHAFLFAVIAGFLEAVPVVGPILSAIPPLITALLHSPNQAIFVAVAFLAIQQVEGHLLIPLVMSRQLSLHPVAILLAVITMGGLFGILGIFLAVPATVTAGILYDEFYLQPRLADDGTVDSDIADIV